MLSVRTTSCPQIWHLSKPIGSPSEPSRAGPTALAGALSRGNCRVNTDWHPERRRRVLLPVRRHMADLQELLPHILSPTVSVVLRGVCPSLALRHRIRPPRHGTPLVHAAAAPLWQRVFILNFFFAISGAEGCNFLIPIVTRLRAASSLSATSSSCVAAAIARWYASWPLPATALQPVCRHLPGIQSTL